MLLEEFACQIAGLLEHNKALYFRSDPEIPDFTSGAMVKLIIEGEKNSVEFQLEPERATIRTVLGILDSTIFSSESLKTLLCWNLKSLLSYFRYFVPSFEMPTVSLVDLQPIENFLGLKKTQPKTFIEALNRAKVISKQPAWKPLYKKIHLPLMLKVLPALETTPLLSLTSKGPVFAHYEIEGQTNGRMNNYKKFEKSYLPFYMSPEVKSDLIPRGEDAVFMTADYRGCEIVALQWLSKDPVLQEVIAAADPHAAMYQKLTGTACDTDAKREKSKKIFLRVMYGLGPTGLGELIGVSTEMAKELILRIRKIFSVAWDWMYERQRLAKLGKIEDHFGRPREFPENMSYLARNFSVQGVAATFCLERLIALHDALDSKIINLSFTVHDGYGVVCRSIIANEAAMAVKQTLEDESKICEGLRMGTKVKFGAKLTDMKVL